MVFFVAVRFMAAGSFSLVTGDGLAWASAPSNVLLEVTPGDVVADEDWA